MSSKTNSPNAFLLLFVPGLFLVGCDSLDESPRSKIVTSGLVHRIEFSNDLDPSPRVVALKAEEETSLSYSLGPLQGDVVEKPLSNKLRILLAKGDTVLYIKFQCSVCGPSDSRQPMQRVQYVLERNRSTPIEFRFTPIANAEAVHSQEYPASKPGISLIVLRDGIIYDRVDVPVNVVSEKKNSGLLTERHVSAGNERSLAVEQERVITAGTAGTDMEQSFERRRDGRPDIIFELVERKDTPILLHVHVLNTTLQNGDNAIFRPSTDLAISDESQHDNFQFYYLTRFHDFSEVRDLAKRLYLRLSCLTVSPATRDGQAFRRAAQDQLRESCHDNVRISEKWSPDERKNVGKVLADIGTVLFFHLVDDTALQDGLDRLVVLGKSQLDTDPIRIIFKTEVHLPIQLLHPREEFDPGVPSFFGLLFEVGETQFLRNPRTDELFDFPHHGWETVFGGFKGDFRNVRETIGNKGFSSQTRDMIASFSRSHYEHIKKSVMDHGGSDFGNKTTTKDFLDNLIKKRNSVDLIWTYAHGDTRGWSAPYYPGLDSNPKLIFGWSREGEIDSLPAGTIKGRVALQWQGRELVPLQERPLVVLIACESGAPGPGGTGGNAFLREFFTLGARGIVTTEAEVPAGTASLFGAYLIEDLVSAMPPSKAILNVRRRLLREKNNLWSLLFHYQGAHGIYG